MSMSILEAAPSGATHFGKGRYYRESVVCDGNGGHCDAFDYYWIEKDVWCSSVACHGIRSLNDIAEIETMKLASKELRNIKELEVKNR